MKNKVLYIILTFIFVCTPLLHVHAEFRPELIITDIEMTDFRSMDLLDIQDFLERKNSALATYITENASGELKTASEIIFDASQQYHINPKVLLVLLQKEQSLIEGAPSEYNLNWATGYAVCDSCRTNDPAIQQYMGFGNQVDRAAYRLQYYAQNPHQFTFRHGNLYTIDNQDVMIYNQATASLYNYTPHIHGNYNFWKLWQRWFKQKYPHGSLVKTDLEPTVYRIEYGRKRPITSMSVLMSKYDPTSIITINPSELDTYEEGPAIKFPNYSLFQTPDESIYLLVNDTIRKFESFDLFRKIGFNILELEHVEQSDLEGFSEGPIITSRDAYPTGALIQNEETGGVFYIYDGVRHPIVSKEILETRFKNISLLTKPEEELGQFELGTPLLFPDGTLISTSNSSAVYVIEHGKRRPITSGTIFEELGYDWSTIIETSANALEIHPIGEPIDTKSLNSYNHTIEEIN